MALATHRRPAAARGKSPPSPHNAHDAAVLDAVNGSFGLWSLVACSRVFAVWTPHGAAPGHRLTSSMGPSLPQEPGRQPCARARDRHRRACTRQPRRAIWCFLLAMFAAHRGRSAMRLLVPSLPIPSLSRRMRTEAADLVPRASPIRHSRSHVLVARHRGVNGSHCEHDVKHNFLFHSSAPPWRTLPSILPVPHAAIRYLRSRKEPRLPTKLPVHAIGATHKANCSPPSTHTNRLRHLQTYKRKNKRDGAG